MAAADHWAGRRRRGAHVTETPGVTSYTPADGAARLAAALGGERWQGAHRGNPPPFTGMPSESAPFNGHPVGVPEATLGPELDQLADVQQAPEMPEPAPEPSLGQLVAGHAARLAAVEGMAHVHEPLGPDEWDG